MAEKSDVKPAQSLDVFWGRAEELEPVFADNLLFQRVNDQYFLTFGQIRLPTVGEPTERVVAEIRPIVRLVLSKQSLKKISEVLSKNLEPEK